jgi:anti-anti-sigma factor
MDVRESGNTCTIRLKGRLVREAVDQFDAAVRSAQGNGCSFLILDLEGSSYIDSCGIGAIVSALRTATQLGGSVQLVKLSSFAEKTFKMCGILGLFGVYQSEAEAISACSV